VASIVAVSSFKKNADARISATIALEEIIATAEININKLIAPTEMLTTIAKELPGTQKFLNLGREFIPHGDEHPAREWFLETITKFPQIVSIKLGYENGSFYQITNLNHVLPTWSEGFVIPENARFSLRRIQGNIIGRFDDWVFLDKNLASVGIRRIPEPAFDPRGAWFQKAMDYPESAHKEISVLSQTGLAGITLLIQTNDTPKAALAINVSLKSITEDLIQLSRSVSSELIVAVVYGDDQVIATSDERFLTVKSLDSLPTLASLRSHALNATNEKRDAISSDSDAAVLVIKGGKWASSVKKIPSNFGNHNIFLLAAIPLD